MNINAIAQFFIVVVVSHPMQIFTFDWTSVNKIRIQKTASHWHRVQITWKTAFSLLNLNEAFVWSKIIFLLKSDVKWWMVQIHQMVQLFSFHLCLIFFLFVLLIFQLCIFRHAKKKHSHIHSLDKQNEIWKEQCDIGNIRMVAHVVLCLCVRHKKVTK